MQYQFAPAQINGYAGSRGKLVDPLGVGG